MGKRLHGGSFNFGTKRQPLRFAVFVALVALLFCKSAFAQAPAPETIRVVCLNRPLPVVAALAQGFYAKYGLSVEFDVAPGSEVLRQDLAIGMADVAFIANDNAVAMVDAAHVDVVIVMGGESAMNELIVQPEIKTVAELRGRTGLVDAPNTAFALQLKKILLNNGLQPGKDVEIKSSGSTAARLQAMKDDKQNGASIMNPPVSIIAKRDGFVSFGSMQKLIGADQDRATFALRPWARAHSVLLEKYLAGYIQGQRWLDDPANKADVIALVMKENKIDAETAAGWYAAEIQAGAYPKDARFDEDNFKRTLRLRAEVEGSGKKEAAQPERYVDLSYYRAALAKLK